MDFLAVLGCDTTLQCSQGVTTQVTCYAMQMEILIFVF